MKKPKKPKAKAAPARSAAVPPRHSDPGRAALGAAAQAFLSRSSPAQPAARRQSAASSTRAVLRPGPDLGTAARAFLARQPVRPAPKPVAASRSMTDALDQREVVTLLVLPFFLLAFALGMSQTWRHPARTVEAVRPQPPAVVTAARAPEPVMATPAPAPAPIELATPALRLPTAAPVVEVAEVRLAAPAMVVPRTPPPVDAPPAVLEVTPPLPRFALPHTPPAIDLPEIELAAPRLALPAGPPEIAPPRVEPPARLAVPAPVLPGPSGQPAIAAPPPEIAACPATPGFGLVSYSPIPPDPALSFGDRLALAARAQTSEVVIYNDKYRRMAFPMGDTHALYGVCTDVVVRAYRALGVDLQELVQKARVGSGDTNIDHRRTETLRRFFASRGQSLPVTSFPENYRPGDIVTYHRPQNRHSRSHIAIVSDVIAPSGRPMIVHNRGWGPQLEDGLFVDRITGHYRFDPKPTSEVVAAAAARASTPTAADASAEPKTPAPAQSSADAAALRKAKATRGEGLSVRSSLGGPQSQ